MTGWQIVGLVLLIDLAASTALFTGLVLWQMVRGKE